jgi:hypothetical protein
MQHILGYKAGELTAFRQSGRAVCPTLVHGFSSVRKSFPGPTHTGNFWCPLVAIGVARFRFAKLLYTRQFFFG